jgi:hypothetical protein
LAHCAPAALPLDLNQRETTTAFVDGVRDRELKQRFLFMAGDRSFNKNLEQALKLEAAKTAAGPPARLYKKAAATTRVSQAWTTGKVAVWERWSCQERISAEVRRRGRRGNGKLVGAGEKSGKPTS